MGVTRDKAETLRGIKFYRFVGDEVEILRVVDIKTDSKGDGILVCKSDNGKTTEEDYDKIMSECTRLVPDGLMAFTIGRENTSDSTWFEDICVATYMPEDINNGMRFPSLICRQYVKDFMYNMMNGDRDHDYIGICVTKNEIPQGMNAAGLTTFNSISMFKCVHFYLNDSVDTILEILSNRYIKKIDKVLETGFQEYIKHIHGIDLGQKHLKGHCRDLKTLLEINNYQFQQDSLYNITPVTFNIMDNTTHIIATEAEYDMLNDDLLKTLSNLYQKKITKAITLEYDHDIDLKKLNSKSVILIRDNTDKVYLIYITAEGEWLKGELDTAIKEAAYDSIRLVNKYGMKKSN